MKNSTYIQKKWMHFKVSTLSASITALIIAGIPNASTASDIDIYQAGGTGNVNIKFMLDRSLSMGTESYGKLQEDYQYKKCDLSQTESKSDYKYTPNNNGSRYRIEESFFGTHNKVGNDYVFVGAGNGLYVLSVNSGGTRLNKTASTVTVNKCQLYCDTTPTLPSALKVEGNLKFEPTQAPVQKKYEYTYSSGKYCSIVLHPNLQNSIVKNDKDYVKKIQNTCELKPNKTDEYYCLDRFSNLKKALYTLVFNDQIDSNKYFALGAYSTGITPLPFTSMDDAGKKKFLDKVSSISLSGATPIAEGYNTAGNFFTSSNMPTQSGASASCTGNGIYFLTDGVPQASATDILTDTDSNSKFNPRPNKVVENYFPLYWQSVAGYAKALKVGTYKIKTATVGLGSDYFINADNLQKDGNFDCNLYGDNRDQKALCYWGVKTEKQGNGYGEGGFYTAQSSEDLINSILQFVSDVSVPIEGSTMGASTVPVDALNTTQLQPYSYFPMFKPLINSDDQLWAGNLKKFKINTASGTIVDQKNNTVFEGNNIRGSLEDYWYESAGSPSDDTKMAWGGLLSKLKVHSKPALLSNGKVAFNRELYVNQSGQLKKATEILDTATQPENAQYLYGLLGYSKLTATDFAELKPKSYGDQLTYLNGKSTLQNYQMGSVIHSTPIMLTQEGSFGYDKDNNYVSKGRKDYILTGTTQGLVQVVNAESGKEVFSFLPAEFLSGTSNQAKGFAESLAMDRKTDVNKDQFFYGVDGQWVAHTEYKNKFDVATDAITNKTLETESLVASKQYVYGGLRMGGKSYYGLDLTKLGSTVSGEKPTMLFHIDPANATANTALSYMGQSWSKPTVTYIRWNGQKKLAMIVGGGYDPKYENPEFKYTSTDTVKGNGIYIFDALNGDLLWWSSSNAPETDVKQATLDSSKRVTTPESNKISTMTNSIPSRIKAVDRDGDGITDHLYTGDLGGQVFRVDLNSKHKLSASASEQQPLVLNAFKLADLNKSDKTPRRFYEAPTFTIHKEGGIRFAIVAFASGDRSSPLKTADTADKDLVVAIKDTTVTQTPVLPLSSYIILDDLRNLDATSAWNSNVHKGWYYPMPLKTEVIREGGKDVTYKYQTRGFEEGMALDNDLYFSLFNPKASTATDADGKVTSCTGGITGESTATKFCLPYGDCLSGVEKVQSVGTLGPGILGLTLGPGRSKEDNRTLIFNKDVSTATPEYSVKDKLLPKRWFEYLPYKSGS